jgi:iron(III) transport system ATP-binding protein
MNQLKFENVNHTYSGPAVVNDVSFAVQPGQLTCLLGPSGCGKTTLLRLAAGLENLQNGRISIGETIIADAIAGKQTPPERRGVGMMFQDYALFPHLTILKNITFGLDHPSPELMQWIQNALDRIGLTNYVDSYPHVLSGGQQQRVALLRAIAPQPGVLLLDEPFSDLDVTLRIQVREDTLRLLRESGIATLMVTHDPEEAMYMADRILIMQNGCIIQDGTPEETYCQPASAYVAALFGPVNRLSGIVKNGSVDTPMGRFQAAHLADGTFAQVFIRPEGVFVNNMGDTTINVSRESNFTPITEMQVANVNLLGRSSHLHLCHSVPAPGKNTHLLARIHGVYLPERGKAVQVQIDQDQAFVFPAENQ